ncbi:MAG: SusC/RagA family TonB-linked outer membrane protein [Saprospiraceae bacterium]|nr:SusC/RagA family TonB-linked outer membrane protein [Saprospiraceae bacterium]
MKLRVDYCSKWLLVALIVTMGSFAFAQRTITGKVTDQTTGDPLIGANILVIGTSVGTVTDIDGAYSLEVPEGATQIEFSYTGYASQRITLGASNVLDIQLNAGELLEEVIVVGYGTQKSKEITSAISSVKEEDFNKGNVSNPAQLLQGKVAGLSVTRPGSNPNQGFNIRLRGLSTVGANTAPLIIIDGVIGADLNSVDPNDIASIDVLKDGSAAAIYGTRGASGVIIISTKKGQQGTATVDYNGFVTADLVASHVEVLTADQYRSFRGGPDGSIRGTDLGSDTDWFDEITRTGVNQVHNLALSGGSTKTSYRISANYRDNEGVALNTGFTQLNARMNLTQKALKDRLSISFNVSTTNRNEQYGFNEAFRYATIYNPTAPIRESTEEAVRYDGYFQRNLFDYYNPVAILEQNVNEAKRNVILANVRGDFKLLDNLTLSGSYSRERKTRNAGRYFDKNSFWVGANRNGLAGVDFNQDEYELFESTAEFFQDFGNLNFRALGGYSFQEFTFDGFGSEGGNFLTDAFGYDNINAAQDFDNGLGNNYSYKNTYRLIAFFGRVNFNFDNTYFLTASLRREGTSRFGEDNRWGYFPAVSAGVTLTNLFAINGVDNLKLRVGYGVTGNIPNESYLSLRRFGPTGNFLVNGNWIPSYGPVSNPNSDLKWETKSDISVGLDFNLMDYKLNGSLDFFSTSTQDLILNFNVPVPPNLFGQTYTNVGELKNAGLELVLNYNAITTPNFSWTTGINATRYLENKIVSLSEGDFNFGGVRDVSGFGSPGQNGTPLIRIEEGKAIGQIWGLQYAGVSPEGTWIFVDTDGNGVVEDDKDRAVIGNGLPKAQVGWNNNFTYGNLDLSFFIDGFFGHDLINSYRGFYEAPNAIGSYNILASTLDDAALVRLKDAPKFSSLHVENASFVRLNNATLGYNFKLPSGGSFTKKSDCI